MSYRVTITDTAKQDLRKIAIWIAEQSKDKEIARRFVNELRDECKKLDAFPKSGALPKDHFLKSLGYRFIVHKNYLIFYLTDDEKKLVTVMSVFHAKEDYIRVMRRFF